MSGSSVKTELKGDDFETFVFRTPGLVHLLEDNDDGAEHGDRTSERKVTMSAITAILPYFGSKRTLAPRIVEAIGDHKVYWDPFCGSLAPILAKPICGIEIVNDLHGDVINLARVIQHPALGPAMYRRLRRVWSSEVEFRDSQAIVRLNEVNPTRSPDIDRAYHFFIASWQGMNGLVGADSHVGFARRFSSSGGGAGTRWTSAVRSIPEWRRRLEKVQVLQTDGIELCEKIEDKEGTVIYCDPPYLEKGTAYVHDFAPMAPGDPTAKERPRTHERLAAALRRFRKTRVIVSYYDHPYLGTLYPGWWKRHLEATKNLVNPTKRGEPGASRGSAPEVLLTNLPWVDAKTPETSLFGEDQ